MKKHSTVKTLLTIGMTIGTTLLVMHAANKLILSLAKKQETGEDDYFYPWRNGNIHYIKKGKGSPILLIHDLSCVGNAEEWSETMERLSQTNTVYALDLLGCGLSEQPKFTYTNFLYVQLIRDFVTDIIGEPCDVIASGRSASFTAIADKMDSELFVSMTFVQPKLLSETSKLPTKKERTKRLLMQLPIVGTFAYLVTHISDVLTKGINSPHLHASCETCYCNADVSRALRETATPIHIILSGHHKNTPTVIEEYLACKPSIEIETISGTLFAPHRERTGRFCRSVMQIVM